MKQPLESVRCYHYPIFDYQGTVAISTNVRWVIWVSVNIFRGCFDHLFRVCHVIVAVIHIDLDSLSSSKSPYCICA